MHRPAGAKPVADRRPPHQVTRTSIEAGQPCVVERGRGRHGVDALVPQCIAPKDVADARTHTLVEHELRYGAVTGGARQRHDCCDIQARREDVRAKAAADRGGADQLAGRRREEDRLHVTKVERGSGEMCGAPASLARLVHVPRPGHTHVRVQHDRVVEMHVEVLADRLDA